MQLASGKRRRTVISLTPLIDVVFILLLFFMLTSNFVPWRILETNIPRHTSPLKDAVIYSLILKNNDAEFWYENQAYPLSDKMKIKQLITANEQAIFAIQTEKNVTLQSLIQLADYVKQQGAAQVSIAGAFSLSTAKKVIEEP